MKLKILLPYKIFLELDSVESIVMETSEGAYGLLPQRLDCVAALVPGIFTYEIKNQGIHYIAIDEGMLVKAGSNVLVSVRNAIGGADLGKLRASVEQEFMLLDEKEKGVRSVLAKMESQLMHNLEKFHNE